MKMELAIHEAPHDEDEAKHEHATRESELWEGGESAEREASRVNKKCE